jgi:nucleoside-diphosphate-sugar epimerase
MASIISRLIWQGATKGRLELFADTLLASRDYVPIEYVSDAVLDAVREKHPSGIYNLGSGVSVSFSELLMWVFEFLDPDSLSVSMIKNPHSRQYQYWTGVDMSKTLGVFTGLRRLDCQDVKHYARRLFEAYVAFLEATKRELQDNDDEPLEEP